MTAPRESDAEEIVYQRAGINWSLVVRATADRLFGFMDIEPTSSSGNPPTPEDIEEALRPAQLTLVGDLIERMAPCFAPEEGMAVAMPRAKGLLIAEGIPPSKGGPSGVKWFVEWKRTRGVSVVEDQADYHDSGHIVQVKEGEAILEIVPPTRGESGVDIFGEPIPGLMGDPIPYAFGDNVIYDEKSNVLRATTAGEVRRDDGQVRVNRVFRVEGDVDYGVGNIEFEGDVTIDGNVQDGFSVKAGGDIRVYGSVMAATLEAGRHILIGEGATGREKGSMKAGANLQAKYLNGMSVNVGGDLKITNEVINCRTRVGGRAVIERGAIVGGDLVAMRGLETRAIGTQISLPTVVRVGVDPEVDARRQGILERLKAVNKHIERIFLNIKPFVENPAKVATLPPQRRELVRQFLIELAGLKAERGTHEQDLRSLRGAEVTEEDLYVRVSKVVYTKVELQIGPCTQKYEVELYGPVTLVPDGATGRLRSK
ncbi:MAG: hypothetical protein A3F84_24220 [Candidatus Handelsmanbacteria bacterium RIFCSPLOWO2_12_FULL_64_10]|uniref:Flagellar Assembly Protein A N-terminal region domain-containing protein n=1 Tax=Handelsmanbacteria sp. (strain RIFCSPLOWO2_12_FULL_64_10) TaxID=1817868 RepID=A0A1F6D1F2_HANXR|nr:MAG: hypothetical protein A3F84_24220 [Candidatus Handelsmanbacteria bacterium RIFCSPLOWO2_12_FULL_64_10]